jgi:hypothetical protein
MRTTRKRLKWHAGRPSLSFHLFGSSLIKMAGSYGFFRFIFWWSRVISRIPAGRPDAFQILVFGSDIFNGELWEFDPGQKRLRRGASSSLAAARVLCDQIRDAQANSIVRNQISA